MQRLDRLELECVRKHGELAQNIDDVHQRQQDFQNTFEGEKYTWDGQHLYTKDRIDQIEGFVKECADKHRDGLDEFRRHHVYTNACERGKDSLYSGGCRPLEEDADIG